MIGQWTYYKQHKMVLFRAVVSNCPSVSACPLSCLLYNWTLCHTLQHSLFSRFIPMPVMLASQMCYLTGHRFCPEARKLAASTHTQDCFGTRLSSDSVDREGSGFPNRQKNYARNNWLWSRSKFFYSICWVVISKLFHICTNGSNDHHKYSKIIE